MTRHHSICFQTPPTSSPLPSHFPLLPSTATESMISRPGYLFLLQATRCPLTCWLRQFNQTASTAWTMSYPSCRPRLRIRKNTLFHSGPLHIDDLPCSNTYCGNFVGGSINNSLQATTPHLSMDNGQSGLPRRTLPGLSTALATKPPYWEEKGAAPI